MNEFVTVSENRTVTAHGIFNIITNGIRIQENMKLATKIEKIEVGTSSRILKTMRIRPIIIIVFMLIPSLMKWQQSYH